MEKIYVYLGSDHVIQQPCFGVRKTTLILSTSREAAISQACAHDAAGVLNTYTLDLDQLSVKAPGQEVLGGFESYDVVLPRDAEGCFISICSETALHRLEFADATFVNQ